MMAPRDICLEFLSLISQHATKMLDQTTRMLWMRSLARNVGCHVHRMELTKRMGVVDWSDSKPKQLIHRQISKWFQKRRLWSLTPRLHDGQSRVRSGVGAGAVTGPYGACCESAQARVHLRVEVRLLFDRKLGNIHACHGHWQKLT